MSVRTCHFSSLDSAALSASTSDLQYSNAELILLEIEILFQPKTNRLRRVSENGEVLDSEISNLYYLLYTIVVVGV